MSQSIIKEYAEEALINDTDLARMNDSDDSDKKSKMIKLGVLNFETEIVWSGVITIFLFHAIGFYSLFTFNYLENPMTTLWILGMFIISNIGVAGGVHRLWTHRCYKATLPLRIFFLLCFSASGQMSIRKWVHKHRMHHKYSETNSDPYNTSRGFFFAHVGWVMLTEHPECTKKRMEIDISDILSDPVVLFDERFNLLLQLLFCFILPPMVPVYLWNETWNRAIISQFIRYMFSIHSIWTINSVAHAFGTRPYNKNIIPADNHFVNLVTLGEGYHNFHHVFPWDYRSSEKGNNKLNYTTYFIDICAKLGQAYDLRYPSDNLIKQFILKKGDGTHPMSEIPRPEFN